MIDQDRTPLVIVRGIPGSGKTTFAKARFPNRVLIEADDYFMVGGEYLFDHGEIQNAHKWCKWRVFQSIKAGRQVAVCNTFTQYWEMKDYLAAYPNAPVFRCKGEWQNTHGVPDVAVKRMADRFEDLAGEIIVTDGGEEKP